MAMVYIYLTANVSNSGESVTECSYQYFISNLLALGEVERIEVDLSSESVLVWLLHRLRVRV